jgi:hypothetical protein
MSYEAIQCGLKMQPHQGEWSRITPTDSMTGVWKILEYIPVPRLSYKDADSVQWWYVFINSSFFFLQLRAALHSFSYHFRPPHQKHPRQVQDGQLIHHSVLEELAKGYKPKAYMSSTNFNWDKNTLEKLKMIETDPYAQAGDILFRLSKPDLSIMPADVHVLRTLSSSGEFVFYSVQGFKA